jgi:hypothetical protein
MPVMPGVSLGIEQIADYDFFSEAFPVLIAAFQAHFGNGFALF